MCEKDIILKIVSEMQKKYNEILNSEELNIILDKGRDKTKELAKEKFELMKKRMGVGR